MSSLDGKIKAQKLALRKEMRSRLQTVSAASLASQSQKAAMMLLSLPEYRSADSLSVYLSMASGEAQTSFLVRDALEKGKKVFVPHIQRCPTSQGPSQQMSMLRLDSAQEFDGLRRGVWGIPQLAAEKVTGKEDAVNCGLDLMIMPGLAFDASGNRLGHGKGFYDEFLARFCGRPGGTKPFLGESSV